MAKKKPFTFKCIGKLIGKIILWFVVISVVWVLAYRFINPPITWLMLQRNVERKIDGKAFKLEKNWVKFEDLPLSLKKAAVAAEDQLFLEHHGFDINAIEKAYLNNQKGKKIKGGSTISQQTAKNVFLWPGRSFIRKGFEAYFTLLIEVLWSKERIMEIYLNIIEMGDGIYGAEAAAQAYFNKSAPKLTRAQSALIVACFPNPRRWSPKNPTNYIYKRQNAIIRNMKRLGPLDF
jgi:monofunctional biosynthetic peptidoglycan transglycosylase